MSDSFGDVGKMMSTNPPLPKSAMFDAAQANEAMAEIRARQPATPQFARDAGIGMYSRPLPGTTDLKEPGMFASNDGTVINWLGENYYKACGEQISRLSSCVKRVGHPNDHEDYDGQTKGRDKPIDFSDLPLEEAVGQAVGAASMCWSHLDSDCVFNNLQAADIVAALMKRIRQAGPIYD